MNIQTETKKRDSNKQYWTDQINGWKQSGISQTGYCEEHNLNPHTFKYWKYKFDKSGQNQKQKPLLPVSIHSDPKPSSFCGISLTFRDRFTIKLDEEFNHKTLYQVIKVLEEF